MLSADQSAVQKKSVFSSSLNPCALRRWGRHTCPPGFRESRSPPAVSGSFIPSGRHPHSQLIDEETEVQGDCHLGMNDRMS